MSREEQRAFFMALLEREPAANIARETGYSDGTVSQVKHGKYKGDETAFLSKVLLIYGQWSCEALDATVSYKECAAEQTRPYSAGRVRQWAICQQCERRAA
ncbi:hypothetical protein L4X63_09445 [Geomonas sp. Red32]|uniref:hypothetical protein n=1 Tax=Geomonas sp. Red32 TaxID=2912856 RepID=UPI00202CC35D|nr:hypothetical protein [Geomonas sp. Red32]MCM0081812.1 hypothetical protein [Geomonas sp. Red32]